MVAPAFWVQIDQGARRLLPALTTFLLILVMILPTGLPMWGMLAPPLTLAAIYYWSLSRPGLLPPSAAFLLGLVQDLLTGGPPGSTALVLVIVQWVLRGQQRYLANRSFPLLWAGFAPVALGAAAIEWLVYAAYTFAIPPIADALVRAGIGFVLFPIVAGLVLIPVHRTLAAE